MALLDDLSGLSGENLASAMLAHLMLRSEPVRKSITALLSNKSPIGPIIVNRHFSCHQEVYTAEGKRIDLLIQTDDAVIGIEVKFNAGFHSNQPSSYLKLVQDKAGELNDVWNAAYQPVLFVLGPDRRRNEINQKIGDQGIGGHCEFVSWQELMSAISREQLLSLESVDRFLVDELVQFVSGLIGIANLDRLICHLDKKWQPRGSAVVREVVDKILWPLVDEQARESYSFSGGIQYYGYYLAGRDQDAPLWIGFKNAELLGEIPDRGAALFFGFRKEAAVSALSSNPGFRRVTPQGWESYHCVAVENVTSWTQFSQWETAMQQVNAALLIGSSESGPQV